MKIPVVVFALAISSCLAMPDQRQNVRQRRDHLESADLGINYGASQRSQEALSGYSEDTNAAASGQASAFAEPDAQASNLDEVVGGGEASEGSLRDSIPGVPGDDYPIFSEVPETSFTCEGKVNGGYYADTEARCQAFHICAAGLQDEMIKYSLICPNGTIFNQEYFICDWWFNVDCSAAAALASSRNAELESARVEAEARIASEASLLGSASASAPISTYGAKDAIIDSSFEAASNFEESIAPVSSYGVVTQEAQESTLIEEAAALPARSSYGGPIFNSDVAAAASAPVGAYGSPGTEEAASARVLEDSLPSYGGRR